MRGRQVGDEELGLRVRKRVVLPPRAFRLFPLEIQRAPDDERDPALLEDLRVGLDAMERALRDGALGLLLDPPPELK